jgi:predicted peptidase
MRQRLWVALAASSLLGCGSLLEADRPSGEAAEVFLPAAYNADPSRRWPLILSLHGAGGLQPADNLIEVHAKRAPQFPFIVIAPRSYGEWNPSSLVQLLAAAKTSYRIDESRIYVTGISMGARGAWNLAALSPKALAAVVLIAGNPDPSLACELRDIPVWLFHNLADPVVPVASSRAFFDAHQSCKGETHLTMYDSLPPGTWTHNAWQAAWTTPELYEWLLTKHR